MDAELVRAAYRKKVIVLTLTLIEAAIRNGPIQFCTALHRRAHCTAAVRQLGMAASQPHWVEEGNTRKNTTSLIIAAPRRGGERVVEPHRPTYLASDARQVWNSFTTSSREQRSR